MKWLCLPAVFLFSLVAHADDSDSTIRYDLPDSVKAVQFIADVNIKNPGTSKGDLGGIQTDIVKLYFTGSGSNKTVAFLTPKGVSSILYNWKENTDYKLLLSTAVDSAGDYSIYTGYIWLPEQRKWKMVGSHRVSDRGYTMTQPSAFYETSSSIAFTNVWIQRQSGSWKNINDPNNINPSIYLFNHVDSVAQRQKDIAIIQQAMRTGRTDVTDSINGVYYRVLKEGTGEYIQPTDTLTAYYKLTLLGDTSIIDQAQDKPATFPLTRLIKGWPIGLAKNRVGGTIRLVIPSDLAYSIRTRSPKIPPNSILVFDIEVLSAKHAQPN